MAEIIINNVITLGLVEGHQATIYEAYEEYVEGVPLKPLFLSGENTVDLLGMKFPLKRENGDYFPPENKFISRVKLKADNKYTEWFYMMDCNGRCSFDYTLPVYFCEEG